MIKSALKATVQVFTGSLVSRLFYFLHSAWLVRLMSVQEYADYAYLISVQAWVLVISHSDFYSAVSKTTSEAQAKGDRRKITLYYFNAMAAVAVLSLFGIIIAIFFSNRIHLSIIGKVAFISMIIVLSLTTINDGLLKGLGNFFLTTIVDLASGIARFVLLFLFAIKFDYLSINNAIIILFLAIILSACISFFFVINFANIDYKNVKMLEKEFEKDIVKDIFSYSKWICITDLFGSGTILISTFFLTFVSKEDLARFSVAIMLYSIFQIAFGSVSTVALPKTAAAKAQNKFILLPERKIFLLSIIGCTLFVLVLVASNYGEQILLYVFGKKELSNTFELMIILVLSLPFKLLSETYKSILQGLGNSKKATAGPALGFLFHFSMQIPLYFMIGIHGVFISLFLAQIIQFVITRRILSNFDLHVTLK